MTHTRERDKVYVLIYGFIADEDVVAVCWSEDRAKALACPHGCPFVWERESDGSLSANTMLKSGPVCTHYSGGFTIRSGPLDRRWDHGDS